jgi:hypothetical protein
VKTIDDPRLRWRPKYLVLAWVVMGWSLQGPLTERCREAYELLAALFPRRRRSGTSYPGLTNATERIGLELFHHFWNCLRVTFPQRTGPLWRWYGWVVMAVDGSRIDAPRTRGNEQGLGRCGRDKTHPQWWITWLIHLPTNLIWDWRQGPGDSSERSHMDAMTATLPPDTLLVADIGFGGFDFLGRLRKAGVDFVVRCGGNTTLRVEGSVSRLVRKGGQTFVYLWPVDRRGQRPLRLRLIVIKKGKAAVYLLTNVQESTRLSRAMAGELYRLRWDIEVEYRGLKQTLNRRKVLAKTPSPGGMELAGNVLAMGLLMVHAALALAAKVPRASVAGILRVIQRAVARLIHKRRWRGLLGDLRRALKDTYTRRSSKRARDWPHKKKDRPPGTPKMRRLTSREKAGIQALIIIPKVKHG